MTVDGMGILAESEMLGWANLVVSFLLTIAMAYIGSKTRKIETLETDLKAAADKSIDSRFQIVAAEFRASIAEFNVVTATMKERLAAGDAHFKTIDAERHRMELKTQQLIGDLKNWVMENAASKHDVEDLSKRFTSFQLAVSRELAEFGGKR